MTEFIEIHLSGGTASGEVHLHFDRPNGDNTAVVEGIAALQASLTAMESRMSDMSTALTNVATNLAAMKVRITEDFDHLKAAYDEAIAAAAEDKALDQATIDRLNAQVAASVASVQAVADSLGEVDPDTGFPVIVVPDPVEPDPAPPVDETPVDPGTPAETPVDPAPVDEAPVVTEGEVPGESTDLNSPV